MFHFVEKMLSKFFILVTVSFVATEDYKCDPFPFGTNIVNVVVAAFIGTILPNSCPCSYPCTSQSVKEHVQFFYTKRFFSFFEIKIKITHMKET